MLQEGYFSDDELRKMAQEYLSPKEEEKMMTNAQIWKQEGIAIGEQRGIEIGEQRGEQRGIQIGEQRGSQMGAHQNARLVTLRGYFKKQKAAFLADLAGLSLEEVTILIQGFNIVKKAWKKKSVPVADLALKTTLTELEVLSIVQFLDSTRPIVVPVP